MTLLELKEELKIKDVYRVVKEYILNGQPVCFGGKKDVIWNLKETVSDEFGLNIKAIEIVGSAKLGFSLNPNKIGQTFNKTSDVDLLIVSSRLFDLAWNELLKLDFHYHRLTPKDKDFLKDCYETIHRGYISPERIPKKSGFGRNWWSIFDKLSNKKEFEYRKIRARIFKNWEFAEKYYSIQLVELSREKNESKPYNISDKLV